MGWSAPAISWHVPHIMISRYARVLAEQGIAKLPRASTLMAGTNSELG